MAAQKVGESYGPAPLPMTNTLKNYTKCMIRLPHMFHQDLYSTDALLSKYLYYNNCYSVLEDYEVVEKNATLSLLKNNMALTHYRVGDCKRVHGNICPKK